MSVNWGLKMGSKLSLAAKGLAVLVCAGLGTSAFAQTSASPYTSAKRYDAMARVTGTLAPDPDGAGPLHYLAVRYTYDSSGRLVQVENGELLNWQSEAVAPLAWAGFTVSSKTVSMYDTYGRKVRDSAFGSNGVRYAVTDYSYDTLDRLVCTAVRMDLSVVSTTTAQDACTLLSATAPNADRITKKTYDSYDRVTKVQKALGTSTQIDEATYTFVGTTPLVATMTDARGYMASMSYDGFGRQVAWIFPSKTSMGASASCNIGTISEVGGISGPVDAVGAGDDCEKYSYDRNGNRAKLVKRDGSVLTYSFDALNRVTSKIVPERLGLNATHTRDVYYSYDLRGLMTAARFDSVSGEGVSSQYDGFGRLTGSTLAMDAASRNFGYQYDADGNRIRVTYPDANIVTHNYDGLDRPDCILMASTATCAAAPAANKVASYAYNGIGQRTGFNGAVTTSYGYDTAGRLNSLTNNLAASAYNNQWSFGYNPASQITTNARSNDAFAWTGAVDVTRPYSTNGLNQYTAAGSVSFCYDSNGNLTADGDPTLGTGFVYLYDVENRLVEMRARGTGNANCATLSYAGALQAALRYDPMGRLYEVTGSIGTTRMLYDGDALTAEYDTAGNLLRRYIHGADLKADDPIAWFEGPAFTTTNERQLRPDWEGSIVLVSDQSGSTVVAVNRYDEYGIPQSTNAGRFQYTGQAWLAELGMYYYKARIYSPTLGRFLQIDPIGYKDQVNLYAYAKNSPVDIVDPMGTDAVAYVLPDNSVVVYLPITFTGDAANSENISAATRNIEQKWTGTFDGQTITTHVISSAPPEDPTMMNTVTLTNGNTRTFRDGSGQTIGNGGHSYVYGSTGQWTTKDINGTRIPIDASHDGIGGKGGDTYAHEGGHLMGRNDQGVSDGGLMGSTNGRNPTGNDVNSIRNGGDPRSGQYLKVYHCPTSSPCEGN